MLDSAISTGIPRGFTFSSSPGGGSQCARCRKPNISLRRAPCLTITSIHIRLERRESLLLWLRRGFSSYFGPCREQSCAAKSEPGPPSLSLPLEYPPKNEIKERPMESVEGDLLRPNPIWRSCWPSSVAHWRPDSHATLNILVASLCYSRQGDNLVTATRLTLYKVCRIVKCGAQRPAGPERGENEAKRVRATSLRPTTMISMQSRKNRRDNRILPQPFRMICAG